MKIRFMGKQILSRREGPFYTVREQRRVTADIHLEQGIW